MTATRIVLATNNAKKLTELRRVVAAHESLAGKEIEVLGLADVERYPEPAETEATFEGNALLKARACTAATGLPALADDSGICIDVLGGMPGVRSARWSGPDGTDEENLQLVLRQLADVEPARRAGRFVAAVAFVTPEGAEHTTRGEMPGVIATAPRGENGFGYDPIFVPDTVADSGAGAGDGRTAAELTADEKDAISHRGHAVRAMVSVIAKELAR